MLMQELNVIDAATDAEYLAGVAVGAGAVLLLAGAVAFVVLC